MTSLESAAIGKSVSTAKTLLGKIFGPTVEEFGLMLSDDMKIRRLKNQINNLKKIEKIVSDNGITTKDIDLKILVPYLNSASLEENETLQDMWANLMVNYIDTDSNLKITVYPTILSQLSSDEVRLLSLMRNGVGSIDQLFPDWKNQKAEEPMLNLVRLGLAEYVSKHEWPKKSRFPETASDRVVVEEKRYALTKFGMAFLDACSR